MWGGRFPVLLLELALNGMNVNFNLRFQSYFIFVNQNNVGNSNVKAN